MLNHIVIMGRLTRDPELRQTQSNVAVASFTVAVDRDFGRGEDRQTDFINCVAWRQTAEFVSKYFHKGSMAVVSGRLQIRSYDDRDGNKRTAAEVVADNVYFGESKRDGDNGSGRSSYSDRGDNRSAQPARNNDSYSSAGNNGGFTEDPAFGDSDGELPF